MVLGAFCVYIFMIIINNFSLYQLYFAYLFQSYFNRWVGSLFAHLSLLGLEHFIVNFGFVGVKSLVDNIVFNWHYSKVEKLRKEILYTYIASNSIFPLVEWGVLLFTIDKNDDTSVQMFYYQENKNKKERTLKLVFYVNILYLLNKRPTFLKGKFFQNLWIKSREKFQF